VHWVVKKLQASVFNGVLTERALETLQFENHWPTPWDEVDPNWYRANFSMVLPDPHSVDGLYSDYRVDNTSARRVWQSWCEFHALPTQLQLNANTSQKPIVHAYSIEGLEEENGAVLDLKALFTTSEVRTTCIDCGIIGAELRPRLS
jgi:hypothetical protein